MRLILGLLFSFYCFSAQSIELSDIQNVTMEDSQVPGTMKAIFNGDTSKLPCDDFWQIKTVNTYQDTNTRPTLKNEGDELNLNLQVLIEIALAETEEESLELSIKWAAGSSLALDYNGDLVSSPKTYQLRYSRYGCDKVGKKGSIVIVPGRSEGSMEYYETAWDYFKLGYAPIYVIDIRGQGLSPRRLSNPHKGHVVNINHYINDLHYALTDAILPELDQMKGIDKSALTKQELKKARNIYYTSNSMGGGIGLGYLMKYGNSEQVFTAAAILGSMIKVNTLSFIHKKPTLHNKILYSEDGAIAQALANCTLESVAKKVPFGLAGAYSNRCSSYTRDKQFGDYKPGTREFNLDIEHPEDMMTQSKERYDMRTFLWDEDPSKGHYNWDLQRATYSQEPEEFWPGPQLGGATFNWVLAVYPFLKHMRTPEGIRELPNTPIKVITGSRDHRAWTPEFDINDSDGDGDTTDIVTSLEAHSNYCLSVNRHNGFGNENLCEFHELKGAMHEIYKETNTYRDEGLYEVVRFFEASAQL